MESEIKLLQAEVQAKSEKKLMLESVYTSTSGCLDIHDNFISL